MKCLNSFRSVASGLFVLVLSGVQFCAAGGNDVNHVPAGYTGKPLTGRPQVIPGVIQAEAYDVTEGDAKGATVGGPGALHKTDLRPGADSLGLARYGSGHVSITGKAEASDQVYVGWTDSGEWLSYTVRVTEPGTYDFGGKFAAGGKGSKISVTFTPGLGTGPVEIPTTAGYQPAVEVYHVWETLDKLTQITLPAGIYVMRVTIEKAAGLNMDYFTFKKSAK
jgi:hypothetical protein